MSKVQKIGSDEFQRQVLDADQPVLVDFYADWCGPCRSLAPVLDEVAGETEGAKIVKVNVDESQDLARQYGVSSIPTLVAFRDGNEVERTTGLVDKNRVAKLVA